MVRTWHFHCWGPGFNPWLGTIRSHKLHSTGKKKKKRVSHKVKNAWGQKTFLVKWHLTWGSVLKIFHKVTNTRNQNYPWKTLKSPQSREHTACAYSAAFLWENRSVSSTTERVWSWALDAMAGWCLEAVFCTTSLLVFFQPSTHCQTCLHSISRGQLSPRWSAFLLCSRPTSPSSLSLPLSFPPYPGGLQ